MVNKKKEDNNKLIIWVVVVSVLVFLFAGGGMMGSWGMMNNFGFDGAYSHMGGTGFYWPSWMGILGFIFSALIIAILVLILIWLVKKIRE